MNGNRPGPSSVRGHGRGFFRRTVLVLGALAVILLAWSCTSLGYLSQAALGQTRILLARKPIERLLQNPETPPALAEKLRLVTELRHFAASELHLPANGSFKSYVELPPLEDGAPRRAVVWNVTATPELSTVPLTWCFPIAGCVSYRGYFSPQKAQRFARRLSHRGFDVAVSGAAAYSTLGWFDDPLLSTVIPYSEVDLAGLVFHELAHQLLYVPGDTRFNESFATTVEIAGVRRWLARDGRGEEELERHLLRLEQEDAFAELATAWRDRLAALYTGAASREEILRQKEELLAAFKKACAELEASWGEAAQISYAAWCAGDLNNAHFAAWGAYRDLVPAFERLLEARNGDLPAFYEAVREIAALDLEEREERLLR